MECNAGGVNGGNGNDFFAEEYPSYSKTPEPCVNVYQIRAVKFEMIGSKSVRVESATGEGWFLPNVGDR